MKLKLLYTFLAILLFLINNTTICFSEDYTKPKEIIKRYFTACEEKNINIIKEILSKSNQEKYNKLLRLHQLIFESIDVHYKDIEIKEIKNNKSYIFATVSVHSEIKSKDNQEQFEKKGDYVFILTNMESPKIVQITNYVNYNLMLKNLLYLKVLNDLVSKDIIPEEDKNESKDNENLSLTNNLELYILKNEKIVNEVNHLDININFLIKNKNKDNFIGYLIVTNISNHDELRKIPLFLEGLKEKKVKIRSEINPFQPGKYTAKIIDHKNNQIKEINFNIK
ncbi:MAG: hypothetical protein PWR24_1222 [Desulfonauticus sp.]|nr:hypothetical protein [Desulfonauticus sp.]